MKMFFKENNIVVNSEILSFHNNQLMIMNFLQKTSLSFSK